MDVAVSAEVALTLTLTVMVAMASTGDCVSTTMVATEVVKAEMEVTAGGDSSGGAGCVGGGSGGGVDKRQY